MMISPALVRTSGDTLQLRQLSVQGRLPALEPWPRAAARPCFLSTHSEAACASLPDDRNAKAMNTERATQSKLRLS